MNTRLRPTSPGSAALSLGILLAGLCSVPAARAADGCGKLPDWKNFKEALKKARQTDNGGLGNEMWGTLMDTHGTVCGVAYTGSKLADQWAGSRLISAEKANTAIAFSLPGMALSTANLYSGVQPKGFLFGISDSHPLNQSVAYSGSPEKFGQSNDPLVGKMPSGVITFGGGLALYNPKGELVGSLGVSGDTSCADHNIAWKLRKNLGLDFVPGGVTSAKDDNIIYLDAKEEPNGFKHARCGNNEAAIQLPAVSKK